MIVDDDDEEEDETKKKRKNHLDHQNRIKKNILTGKRGVEVSVFLLQIQTIVVA